MIKKIETEVGDQVVEDQNSYSLEMVDIKICVKEEPSVLQVDHVDLNNWVFLTRDDFTENNPSNIKEKEDRGKEEMFVDSSDELILSIGNWEALTPEIEESSEERDDSVKKDSPASNTELLADICQERTRDGEDGNGEVLEFKSHDLSVFNLTTSYPCIANYKDFGYDKDFDGLYTIGKLLGHGQFGYTYVATDKSSGDRVAVKRIEKNKMILPIAVEDVK
ncbi:hypothetical protein RHSIM_Rhsim10G0111600 [Rhododendron simsii]|uniref:Protein kinase domain-containing protein n=1 Tax=Rhododendron simsii TaxID=118357 RepID=A0A834GB38_RHOSS|nr:hypothetical protein RHSIM_Rhsim10G0111600 [Rhododendron simsii]